ncbi:hypothetical protein LMZ02_00340 [Paenibacillus macerans]|uniref:hypothetical protein n=1 Tax=Paenibacillus macerans TaxID=44252 RepID=UPI000B1A334A|nr:hypothetical protein [Paenibacillus macerans]MBS5914594.1 hypothetical protein [Paenibacillus macerans]UMV47909.1 hypothetical protein LMZ02_00340 [Paenibacillus macerans]GBK65397.1 hypothetical protein PbDSM24746_54010 [Paenibacillus macerans]GBK71623.1 hypothetical protein PbJCM17693_53310 [Paenibacillus macerans]GIP12984.1 hypothetical protein J1TS5_51540 [Paenibacillus macerans]
MCEKNVYRRIFKEAKPSLYRGSRRNLIVAEQMMPRYPYLTEIEWFKKDDPAGSAAKVHSIFRQILILGG